MSPPQLTSGDVLADRRAGYARMLLDSGDAAAAADLQRQALDLAPGWAAGWHELGLYREAAKDLAGAAEAWRQVLVIEPADMFGAGMKLALVGHAAIPAVPPSEYVAQLFDDYSDRFDTALVEALHYVVPERLTAMIADAAGPGARFAKVIDLGCGTGLFGERIRGVTSWLEGYDLSQGMLAKAAEKGVYDELGQADILYGIEAARQPGASQANLVAAADVFAYFGDLDPVMAVAAGLTVDQGLMALSLEAGPDDCDWVLQTSLRYCHGETYLRRLLDSHGFTLVSLSREPIRRDGSNQITGLLVVARKRSPAAVKPPETAVALSGDAIPVPSAPN
ncbi:putative TPR repeat methyltransferase [Hoeflea marina]|uniref:Putative TPR repeat methyltransferase n=1 Tax=Hoeflea marina TaxID=274592 RepID=A0A317PHI1_9HYPH|nr:SAM-dependent methyltransferase [Hoeflea marina]PWV99881.1 putative TPR repeat methyltransferase [Hoeflea marina]